MNNQQHRGLHDVCERLGYTVEAGLVSSENDAQTSFERYIWNEAARKLGVHAVFFSREQNSQSVPLVYFKSLDVMAKAKIDEIHRVAWNISRSPLLVIVLPTEVRVYSAFQPGAIDSTTGWDADRALVSSLILVAEEAQHDVDTGLYHYSELISGAFWRKFADRFDPTHRVDQTLLNNLRLIREKLMEMGLDRSVVHGLLGRSIFVKFLEERRDNQGYNVFPQGFFSSFVSGAEDFTDILKDNKATYEFFSFLADKFNGDVFPVTKDEINQVNADHLLILRAFLEGDVDLDSGQMGLWHFYSFDVIPIQLISAIYESFISDTDARSVGAYYTPYVVASFMADQVVPWTSSSGPLRILDPACGSGVFLVEAYRRLIEQYLQANQREHLTASKLGSILVENIYGVDRDEQAIRVAAFSLYLTMCDYLEPRFIWESVRFPVLRERNLIVADYFDTHFDEGFDVILGNPPWKSSLTPSASRFVEDKGLVVANKQIAQAFVWKSLHDAMPDGRICLLVPSKSVLFGRSGPNRDFLQAYLKRSVLKTVINFSAMRFGLFKRALAPATALVFTPDLDMSADGENEVVYASPKPVGVAEEAWKIPVRASEVATIPQRTLANDSSIWKVAMWGGPRDHALIRKLQSNQTLEQLADARGWVHGEGFIQGGKRYVGKDKYHAPELLGIRRLDPRTFERFHVDATLHPLMRDEYLVRPRRQHWEIFKAPHLVMKQSVRAGVGIVAAIVPEDAVFSHSFSGIHVPQEDESLLRAVCAVLCSSLATYFMMMTSVRWFVERSELEKGELMALPIPENIESLQVSLADLQKWSQNTGVQQELDTCVFELYGLGDYERALVEDALGYEWDFFRHGTKAKAFNRVDQRVLAQYSDILNRTLEASFGLSVRTHVEVFRHNAVVIVNLPSQAKKEASNFELAVARAGHSGTSTRDVILYGPDSIAIVKSPYKYFWSRSRAMRDADRIFSDIMTQWRHI